MNNRLNSSNFCRNEKKPQSFIFNDWWRSRQRQKFNKKISSKDSFSSDDDDDDDDDWCFVFKSRSEIGLSAAVTFGQNNSNREITSLIIFLTFVHKYKYFRSVLGFKTIAIVQSCESFVLEDEFEMVTSSTTSSGKVQNSSLVLWRAKGTVEPRLGYCYFLIHSCMLAIVSSFGIVQIPSVPLSTTLLRAWDWTLSFSFNG